MMEIGYMKVPDKYEPKNADEFGTFDRAMTRLLAVPAEELKRKVEKHKKRKNKTKRTSARGPSRDSGGEA
jgi:hypothetical protein